MSLSVVKNIPAKSYNEASVTRSMRILYLCLLLTFMVALQSSQSSFLNPSVSIPSYLLISLSLLINFVLLMYEKNESVVKTEELVELH